MYLLPKPHQGVLTTHWLLRLHLTVVRSLAGLLEKAGSEYPARFLTHHKPLRVSQINFRYSRPQRRRRVAKLAHTEASECEAGSVGKRNKGLEPQRGDTKE